MKNVKGLLKLAGNKREVEMKLNKQLTVVDAFVNELFSNAPVMPRIVVQADGTTEIQYLVAGNGPITNHKNIKYHTTAMNLIVVEKDDFDNETTKITKVGPGTNYRYTTSLIKAKVSDATANTLNAIKAESILVKYDNNNKAIDAKVSINGYCENKSTQDLVSQGYVKYAVLNWSNSDERNGGMTLYSHATMNPEEAYEFLNETSGGAFKARFESHGKEVVLKDLEKDISRIGMGLAPMLHGASFTKNGFGLLIVDEKITGVSDYTADVNETMDKMGIDIDNFIFDGAGFYSTDLMIHMAKKLTGIELTDEEAAMISAQKRADVVMSKTYGAFDLPEIFAAMVNVVKNRYKTYPLGNKDNIVAILDKNAYKLLTKSHAIKADEIRLNVLDLARVSISSASTQMLEKFLSKDRTKALKVINALSTDTLNTHANGIYADESNFRFDTKKDVLSLEGDVLSGMLKVNKERVDTDKYAMEKLIAGCLKKQESILTKLKVDIRALYLRALFEYSSLIQDETDYILSVREGMVECYNIDAVMSNNTNGEIDEIIEQFYVNIDNGMSVEEAKEMRTKALDEILTAALIKYPCPGSEEYQLVRFLTLQEIAETIVEKISDEKSRELVFKMFSTKGSGCILIAQVNTVKNKLAGMDTDYDAVAAIFEKELVDIVRNEAKGVAVCIDTDGTMPEYKAKEKAKSIMNNLQFKSFC